jgi:hypothetical protein
MVVKLKYLDITDLLEVLVKYTFDKEEKHDVSFLLAAEKTVDSLLKAINLYPELQEMIVWVELHRLEDEKTEKKDGFTYVSKEEWNKKQKEYSEILKKEVEIFIYNPPLHCFPKIQRGDYDLMRRCKFILEDDFGDKNSSVNKNYNVKNIKMGIPGF